MISCSSSQLETEKNIFLFEIQIKLSEILGVLKDTVILGILNLMITHKRLLQRHHRRWSLSPSCGEVKKLHILIIYGLPII